MHRTRKRRFLLSLVAVALTVGLWNTVDATTRTGAGASTQPLGATVAPLPGAGTPQATYGPILDDFGPVYFNGEVDLLTPLDRDFKALFDVSEAASEPDAASPAIESAARFLNMHAQAGVPRQRLGAAIVLHGGAARYGLSHAAYRQRYEVDNPNLPLIEALRSVGVRIAVCGQTAAARGYAKDELAEPVELALSAMTAVKVLQDEGYQIVSF